MAAVVDVAESILGHRAPLDTFRLQKLVYYAQAVHLARHGVPLFSESIEAWSHGPCVPSLRSRHYREYQVDTVGGTSEALGALELESIQLTMAYYGRRTTDWLVDQSHEEPPWREARGDLPADAPSKRVISVDSIREYYTPILADPEIDAALASVDPETALTVDAFEEKYASYR